MEQVPSWLHGLAIVSLAAACCCSVVIVADLLRGNRQHMWIMNLVWPITALYAGPLALVGYFTAGRRSTARQMEAMNRGAAAPPETPFWQAVGLAATHCGAGCTLGDLVAEWGLFLFPLTFLGRPIFASWGIDYLVAFGFGIAFQYLTIVPMRGLDPLRGLIASLKADSLSLTSWQVGMYGWMAIATFVIFGEEIPKDTPLFWFMMQIAMVAGFCTAFPINWWLLKKGIKEKM
jgi:hypothetical protein